MQEIDPVEKWLNAVGNEHSNNKQVKAAYKDNLQKFADFSGKTPQQIVAEYTKASEKQFKKYYTQLLHDYTTSLQKLYPPNSVREQVNVVRSFFNYYKLPIGFGVRAHIEFLFK